jgi:hypothetical protein
MRKYLDDYEVVVQEDEKGREKRTAVYVGAYYRINIDDEALRKFRRNSLILLAFVVAVQIGSGFIANTGMYTFFVSLPYIFTFLPLYFLVDGGLRLPKEKRDFRRDEAELIFKRMKSASKILFPLLGLTILADIVFLIWFADTSIWLEFLFIGVQALAMVAVFLIIRMQKPIEVTKIDVEDVKIEADISMTGEEDIAEEH